MLLLRRSLRAVALGSLIAWVSSASPVAALPVTIYADGTTDYGFDPADVAAAIAAGASQPTEVDGLSGGIGYITITTPDGISGVKGKNKSSPSLGSSVWTIHIAPQTPQELLENFALVILGHDPNDPIEKYETGNVGLEIDTELPWLFVTPEGEDPIYAAYLLGDVEAGGSYDVPIEYRVGQKLIKVKGKGPSGEKLYMFPRYAYAIVSIPSVVPEPSVLALLLLGAVSARMAARRAR